MTITEYRPPNNSPASQPACSISVLSTNEIPSPNARPAGPIISNAIKPEIITVKNGVRIKSRASGITRRSCFSTWLINHTANSTGNTVP
ncbi:hypothetical protein D3C80_1917330 [compost metagenome]